MKTKRQTIVESLQKIRGVGDFQIVAQTVKSGLTEKGNPKKGRTNKIPCPAQFHEVTKVICATVSLGNNYEEEVNARLLKEQKDADFKAQGTYCYPLTKIETGLRAIADKILNKMGLTFSDKLSQVIFKKNDSEQLYLRVYPNLAKSSFDTHSVHYFDANGVEMTKEEFKAVEAEYFPISAGASQGGLEDKIIVNNYKLENILYLADGDKNPINELTQEIKA